MNHIENNKLIAEFMGAELYAPKDYKMTSVLSLCALFVNNTYNEQGFCRPDEMKFHDSWDWLMPVVGRISEISAGGITYDVQNTLIVADIEKSYNAVIEFIAWNNERHSKEQTTQINTLSLESGHGYWDVTKYPYGGDFKRFKENETGELIKGTVSKGEEICVKLSDGRNIVVGAKAVTSHSFDEIIEQFKNLNSQ